MGAPAFDSADDEARGSFGKMGLVPAVCDLHLQGMGKINRKQLHKVLCADNMLAIYHVNGIGLQRGQSDKFSHVAHGCKSNDDVLPPKERLSACQKSPFGLFRQAASSELQNQFWQILQFCRCGGLSNARGHPDGFLFFPPKLSAWQFFDSLRLYKSCFFHYNDRDYYTAKTGKSTMHVLFNLFWDPQRFFGETR